MERNKLLKYLVILNRRKNACYNLYNLGGTKPYWGIISEIEENIRNISNILGLRPHHAIREGEELAFKGMSIKNYLKED